MYRRALVLTSALLLLSACHTNREEVIMSAGAYVGAATLAPPHGYYLGAIAGSQVYSSLYGEASSSNGNRSCRQLRHCVFAGN